MLGNAVIGLFKLLLHIDRGESYDAFLFPAMKAFDKLVKVFGGHGFDPLDWVLEQ